MMDTAEWDFGTKKGSSASIYGTTYSRVAGSSEVPDGVDTVFLQIGRIPYGFAAGGFVAPPED